MDYWLGVLGAQIPTVVEKAMASEGATSGALWARLSVSLKWHAQR